MEALLKLGVVPVVNENDTVATNEIRFGDNDRLSARVALMASAEELVLLSDVDGLYTRDPASDPTAVRLELVAAITPEIEAMAGGAGSAAGTGGMVSKLAAARIGTARRLRGGDRAGRRAASARRGSPRAAPARAFSARASPRRARKEWLAGALGTMGVIRIDAGAARALRRGSSLLPAGVVEVEGAFERGDAVLVRGPDGADLAKGLCAYDAADARRIRGQHDRADRGAARLARPRRADPPRRSRAALSGTAMLKDWRQTPSARWLLAHGARAAGHLELLVSLCDWLCRRGLPLWQVEPVHADAAPVDAGVECIWHRSGRAPEEVQLHWRGGEDVRAWQDNPLRRIMLGADEIRVDLQRRRGRACAHGARAACAPRARASTWSWRCRSPTAGATRSAGRPTRARASRRRAQRAAQPRRALGPGR